MKQTPIKVAILLISSLTVMSGATIAPSLPQIAKVFGDVPNAEFLSKLILTMPALFVAISAPLAGRFIDKYGRLKLLFVSIVFYAFAGASGFFLNDLYHILIGRAALGVFVGAIMTIATTLIGDYFEGQDRQRFIGIQGAFMALGGVVFVGSGGLLADVSWRAPFLIYFSALIFLPIIMSILKEPKRAVATEEKEGSGYPPMMIGVFATAFIITFLAIFEVLYEETKYQNKIN